MSNKFRDTAAYLASAKAHKELSPVFKKFAKRKTLKPYEKAWITRTEYKTKVRARPVPRDPETYVLSARELAPFVPKIRKLAKKKTLTSWEKSYVARIENVVKKSFTNIDDLIPVSKAQAKSQRGFLYEPEITVKRGKRKGQIQRSKMFQAMQLRNVSETAKIKKVTNETLVVEDLGRTWVYWNLLKKKTPKNMQRHGEQAFTTPEAFDIERVIELAQKAFDNPQTKIVYLWSKHGRVGIPMRSLAAFTRWIIDDYSKYTQTDRWVNGLAILIADAGETISRAEITSFTPTYEARKKRRAENRSIYRKRK
jgi:hypothetical protein